jgi:hypothetical protein
LFIKNRPFFSLLISNFFDLDKVSDTRVKSFFKETSLVLEANSHVRTELGNLEIMDSALSNDLRNDLEFGENLLWLLNWDRDRVALFINFRFNSCNFSVLWSYFGEKIIGDA